MSTLNGNIPMPINYGVDGAKNGAWRGIFGNAVNANKIAIEDWLRAEQSADLAFQRDLEMMKKTNEFNAKEAEKNRDWQERLSNTSYQRAVEDMKKAGINPLMLVSSNGASTPAGGFSGSTSSRSSSARSTSSNKDDMDSVLALLSNIVSGLLTKKIKNV